MRLDEAELRRWGDRIGRTLTPPAVIGLRGPLGSGKSVLARAVGHGAGVRDTMPSPSYNLLLRYPAPSGIQIVHVDLYRIDSTDELWELGWADLGDGSEIVLIEWPERAEGLLPPDHWLISLSVPDGEPMRRDVEVQRVGSPPELAAFPMSVSEASS